MKIKLTIVALAFVLFPDLLTAQNSRVIIQAEAGYSIEWNGNNGNHFDPETGAESPENDAWDALAFASSNYFPDGIHDAVNVVDGYYGNSSSWIATRADADPWLALGWEEELLISRIAWSRDNGDSEGEGQLKDRAVGVYTLQFTRTDDPDEETEEADDPSDGWVTFGSVEYNAGTENATFTSYLHHQFEIRQGNDPIAATGLRVKVSNVGICIDEMEINGPPAESQSDFIDIQATEGFMVLWTQTNGDWFVEESPAPAHNNAALSSEGSVAFGSSELGLGTHLVSAVNDGFYSNAKSWIAAADDQDPFIGVSFGQSTGIKSIAWGRDNGDDTGDCCGGQVKDRWKGVYTLQVTQMDKPGQTTEETGDTTTGWLSIATIDYKEETDDFIPYLRHEFQVSDIQGSPIPATAVRLKVSNASIAIDELEVNPLPAVPEGAVDIYEEESFVVTWNGNQGDFFDASAQAKAPNNAALANEGTVAFGSSELGLGIHLIRHVNDGLYGNSKSWISSLGLGGVPGEQDEFVGLSFGKVVPVSSIAWGRDNGNTATDACGGTCKDRSIGIYTIQYTLTENPDEITEETDDAETGWQTIAYVEYLPNAPQEFIPYLRHEFKVGSGDEEAPVEATGIRIIVSSGMIAIDELEVNPTDEQQDGQIEPEKPADLAIETGEGFEINWDGNEGDFYSDAALAEVPDNDGLAENGAVAFGSSELDFGVHYIDNVNDGFYGNSKSWIAKFTDPADVKPFVGLNFGKIVPVSSIAWGRDNGNNTDDCCGGQLRDRSFDVYHLDYTTVEEPDADTPETDDPVDGWVAIGSVKFKTASDTFSPWLRHRFDVSLNNQPISATGIRIRVNSNQTAIDEIEVNTETGQDSESQLTITLENDGLVISWTGDAILESNDSLGLGSKWGEVTDQSNPYTVPSEAIGTGAMYYRTKSE
jgi:hypothetical protein